MTAPITPDERAAMRRLALTTPQTPGEHAYVEHVPRLLDALDTAEARGRMAETNLTVAGRALGKALAKGARTREENRTLRAERDEARAASARVREAAARCVADEAAESDLTIARQRERLRAREEQVRRLRAEVTRLHALVADMRAATSPAWDEDTVHEAVARAVFGAFQRDVDRGVFPHTAVAVLSRTAAHEVLAVVREHLPVRPNRETAARAIYDAFRAAEAEDTPETGYSTWDETSSHTRHVVRSQADAVLAEWPGESRAQVQATALREAAREEYRVSLDCDNHCDDATASRLRARADRIEKGETR